MWGGLQDAEAQDRGHGGTRLWGRACSSWGAPLPGTVGPWELPWVLVAGSMSLLWAHLGPPHLLQACGVQLRLVDDFYCNLQAKKVLLNTG